MSRLERKCIVASCCLHGFLVVLVLFGSAFFTARKTDPPIKMLNVIPSQLIDEALSGGGGNPKLAQTDERIKGDTMKPVPKPAPPAPEPPKAHPPEAKSEPKVEPAPPEPPKVKPVRNVETLPKVKTVKDPPKLKADEPAKPRIDITAELKPIKAVDSDKEKKRAKEEAEAAERAAEARAAKARADRARKIAQLSDAMQREFGGSLNNLRQGFKGGTAVDVGGPGGAAFANYKQFVQMAYDNAWVVTPELTDQDFVALIKVTVSRTGRILSSRIVKPSGSSTMDRTVQKAMDEVRSEGLPPFPNGATDTERTVTIEFNLKSKSRLG